MTDDVTQIIDLPYPRPQFERSEWMSLNGLWEFEFDDSRQGLESGWNNAHLTDRIVVPFPYQSSLSGINDKGVHEVVWYSRLFEIPDGWHGRDLLLNFGAVDYETMVWINGHEVGHNRGGHVPFSFDIAPYVSNGMNRVTLRVLDRQDPYQPRGKQSTAGVPKHIDYYCTTGIWQSVWLEPVSSMRIESLQITSSVDNKSLSMRVYLHAPAHLWTIHAEVFDGDVKVASVERDFYRSTTEFAIELPNAKLWSPDEPNLYIIKLYLCNNGIMTDEVTTYTGIRSVELRDSWMHLNGKPIYLAMVLDQGYWPESYLASPSDDALREDVEWVKRFGYNGVRKHQKIEDPRWLYWCDKLGLLVWSEMANARAWSPEAEEHLVAEWERAVRRDCNHPCIVTWVPVNESMGFPGLMKSHPGQYAFLERITTLTRRLDPDRPVIDNDGWEHTDITDICAMHDYTPNAEALIQRYEKTIRGGPLPTNAWDESKPMFARGSHFRNQPIMLTEVGGFLMARPDLPKREWDLLYAAYETTISSADFLSKYINLMDGINSLPFVVGFCYTQLVDVEQERNGLLTFDRKVKIDPAEIYHINRQFVNKQPADKHPQDTKESYW